MSRYSWLSANLHLFPSVSMTVSVLETEYNHRMDMAYTVEYLDRLIPCAPCLVALHHPYVTRLALRAQNTRAKPAQLLFDAAYFLRLDFYSHHRRIYCQGRAITHWEMLPVEQNRVTIGGCPTEFEA